MIENLVDIDGNDVVFFHGTTAVLQPGDLIVPGAQIDRAVHFNNEHVYATSTWVPDEMEDAVEPDWFWTPAAAADEAASWGCHAADAYCTAPGCVPQAHPDEADAHYQAWSEDGAWPACVHVYAVAPVDPGDLEPDPTGDVEHGGVRMSAARILHEVNQFAEPRERLTAS